MGLIIKHHNITESPEENYLSKLSELVTFVSKNIFSSSSKFKADYDRLEKTLSLFFQSGSMAYIFSASIQN
jgi:hypothetical protein